MRIDVQFDTRVLEARTLKAEKQLAYGTAQALNKTGLAAQQAVREHMARVFRERSTTKRQRKWLEEQIKLTFASVKKGVLYCELYVAQKDRLLLAGYENAELRTPFVGQHVAVPNPAVAREGGTVAGSVIPAFEFRGLKLKPVHVHPHKFADTEQWKGADRTFLLQHTTNAPLGGVFVRIGPGKDDIRLVYSFRDAFRLRAVLELLQTCKTVMQGQFEVEFAIANARSTFAEAAA